MTKESYYPVNGDANQTLYAKYRQMADDEAVLFGARLGTYRYYDMDKVIAQALKDVQQTLRS